MRVLHLIDAASAQASATTLALMAESLGRLGHVEQKVLLLGGAALRREAEAAGVRDAETVGVPYGRAVLGWDAVRLRLRRWIGGDFRDACDLIHCWSAGSLTLACLLSRRAPKVLTVTTPPTVGGVRWLRSVVDARGGPVVLLPISATLRRDLLSGGVPEPAVHVLRPGLDMGKVNHAGRAALRERWRLPAAALDGPKVVALLSDPPQAADALPAVMAVGLAAESRRSELSGSRDLRLLVHPDQLHRRRAQSLARLVHSADRVIQEPALARPWEVLPACDAALAIGPHAGGLSLLWAMAANVPIIGEARYAISEIVEDRHSALLARPDEPKALAHRLDQLLEDRQLAWRLRDTARHEAYSFFSRQRYCQSLRAVYEQMVEGRPVEVPAMQVTGGLRFSGRA